MSLGLIWHAFVRSIAPIAVHTVIPVGIFYGVGEVYQAPGIGAVAKAKDVGQLMHGLLQGPGVQKPLIRRPAVELRVEPP